MEDYSFVRVCMNIPFSRGFKTNIHQIALGVMILYMYITLLIFFKINIINNQHNRVFGDRMLSVRSSRGQPRPESSGLIRVWCDSIEDSIIRLILVMWINHIPPTKPHAISAVIRKFLSHYNDVIMSTMASQITSVSIVCTTFCSGTDYRKHKSSASLAFVRGIPRTKGQ